LLFLRRTEPALEGGDKSELAVEAWSDDVILVRRRSGGHTLLAVIRLEHPGPVDLAGHPLTQVGRTCAWEVVLTTGAPEFGGSGGITVSAENPAVGFAEPGAVILLAREQAR
jgi:hypothetical protein